MLTYNQPAVHVYRRLRIVGLLEASTGNRHASTGSAQVIRESPSVKLTWSFARGPGSGACGFLPPSLRPRASSFLVLSLSKHLYTLSVWPHIRLVPAHASTSSAQVACLRTPFYFRFDLLDFGQTCFSALQLRRNIQAVIFTVFGFRPFQQFLYLCAQLGFQLVGVFPTYLC